MQTSFIGYANAQSQKSHPSRFKSLNGQKRQVFAILAAVCGFYEFQERLGKTEGVDVYRYQFQPGRKYKPFLHHINKGKEVRTRLLKLKEPKTFPGTLTTEQIKQ